MDGWKQWELDEGRNRNARLWGNKRKVISSSPYWGFMSLCQMWGLWEVGQRILVGGCVIFSRGIVPEEDFKWCWLYTGPLFFSHSTYGQTKRSKLRGKWCLQGVWCSRGHSLMHSQCCSSPLGWRFCLVCSRPQTSEETSTEKVCWVCCTCNHAQVWINLHHDSNSETKVRENKIAVAATSLFWQVKYVGLRVRNGNISISISVLTIIVLSIGP